MACCDLSGEFSRRASKQLLDLTKSMRRRVDAKLVAMEDDPYRGATKLAAHPGFRGRVGDFRILYEIDDGARVVLVNQILHRREAYR